MIDLYTWTTPNGRKVSILLEELGVPYTVHSVDIGAKEQFALDFLRIAPNNRIPAIVDHETGLSLMESGAIMLYLADKYGRFAGEGREHWRVVEWLMWQMAGIGPMLGQAHHFLKYNPGVAPYAEHLLRPRGSSGSTASSTAGSKAATSSPATAAATTASPTWRSGPAVAIRVAEDRPRRLPGGARLVRAHRRAPAVQRGYHVPKQVGEIPMPA